MTNPQARESLFPFRIYDEDAAQHRLLMCPRTSRYGCGIYEVGQNSFRMFVTDTGRAMAVEGRPIQAEDLMEAYVWGRMDAEIQAGLRDPENDE